jgi:hypothetical protein
MEASHTSRFFLEPKPTFQRQYEALRAIFVDGHSEPAGRMTSRAPSRPKSPTAGN